MSLRLCLVSKKRRGERISLLVLDMDLYQPTKIALEHLYEMVTPGGIIVLDEYSHTRWPGELGLLMNFWNKKPELKKFT